MSDEMNGSANSTSKAMNKEACVQTTDALIPERTPKAQAFESSSLRSSPNDLNSARTASTYPVAAVYRLSGPWRPAQTHVLPFMDRLHSRLIRLSGGLPVFTGMNPDGRPASGHLHAFLLPLVDFADGGLRHDAVIGHVLVYASVGFDREARRVLAALDGDWVGLPRAGPAKRCNLDLVALGSNNVVSASRAEQWIDLTGSSQVWRSLTPFVPTRHRKLRRNGSEKLDANGLAIGGPEHDLRRLAALRSHPTLTAVRRLCSPHEGVQTAGEWSAYRTIRSSAKRSHGRNGGQKPHGFELVFSELVTGPLALGFGAHLGLGVFFPVTDKCVATIVSNKPHAMHCAAVNNDKSLPTVPRIRT